VEIVFNTVLAEIQGIENFKKIKFVVFSDENLQLYQVKLDEIVVG